MKAILKNLLLSTLLLLTCNATFAWEGMEMPPLHVEGRNLADPNGNIVKLHGYAQTFSPWFNERGRHWNNYDVAGCLRYNQNIIDRIMAAGWKMNFVRMHMDPYWSNTPGRRIKGENDISAFDFNRFTKYLDEVFVPMSEYAIKKGMYVVMRPPGVCPEKIAVGDDYQKYLLKVWRHVARHEKLKNHPNIMFELANEPINIVGSDGTVGGGSKSQFEQLSKYFQEIADTMRAQGCNNILWVPGLGYQSKYAGYADYPIKGKNIGYAVHIYPGWFGSSHNYEAFARGWKEDVQPVADFAPIMITEMDWADKKYNASWGKAHTGVAGDHNFGANFKKITDDAENVSWLLFTSPEHLAAFKDEPAKDGNYTFLTDPEACPWPVYHWYQEYARSNYPRKMFTRTAANGAATNDNFRHYNLAAQWSWSGNCDSSKWSLTERAGFLRLHTAKVASSLPSRQHTDTADTEIRRQPLIRHNSNRRHPNERRRRCRPCNNAGCSCIHSRQAEWPQKAHYILVGKRGEQGRKNKSRHHLSARSVRLWQRKSTVPLQHRQQKLQAMRKRNSRRRCYRKTIRHLQPRNKSTRRMGGRRLVHHRATV